MELGLTPGTRVTLLGIAPMGDPLELAVRGSALSIRRNEARSIVVSVEPVSERAVATRRPVAAAAPHYTGS
jgi:hypothetical protein